MLKRYKSALWLAALIVGGCSLSGEGLWPETAYRNGPASSSVPPATQRAAPAVWAEPIAPAEPLVLDLPAQREAPDSGTFVGRKVVDLQSDLNLLIAMVTARNDEYAAITGNVAQLSRRIQALVAGTASDDPGASAQMQAARAGLDQIAASGARLTDLSTRVAGNASVASYVSTAAKSAMEVDGGTDEDRRRLSTIVDETTQVVTENDRLLNEISATIARNDTAVAAARSSLSVLTAAIGSDGVTVASQPTAARIGGDTALFVVGFDRSDIEFEQALHDAVTAALDLRPDARFRLIAVEPQRGGYGPALKRSMERVFRSVLAVGLPTDRVTLASETSSLISSGEVQVYAY